MTGTGMTITKDRPAISGELRTFLLAGTVTVPHVEAVLQLRLRRLDSWRPADLGRRLYVSEERARALLGDLKELGVVVMHAQNDAAFRYAPATPTLTRLLDELERAYCEQLVAVTRLIHSAEETKARSFANAFRLRAEES